jgi:hypothetical protein
MATILAGLGLRLLPLGPPFPLAKWGGSVLWAAMVYWLVAALLPNLRAITAAAVAGVVAGTVEMVRLYHSPGLDAFRLTLAGKLLLGRVFSPWHPVVYWATITLAAALDWTLLRRFVRAQR